MRSAAFLFGVLGKAEVRKGHVGTTQQYTQQEGQRRLISGRIDSGLIPSVSSRCPPQRGAVIKWENGFIDSRLVRVCKQLRKMECGLACLAMMVNRRSEDSPKHEDLWEFKILMS